MGDWVPRVLCVSHEVGLQVRLRVGLIEMGMGWKPGGSPSPAMTGPFLSAESPILSLPPSTTNMYTDFAGPSPSISQLHLWQA